MQARLERPPFVATFAAAAIIAAALTVLLAPPVQAARIYLRTGAAYRSPGNIALAVGELLGARAAKRAASSARAALRAVVRGRRGAPAAVELEWLEPYR